EMRLAGVIEGQDDELVRDRLQRVQRSGGGQTDGGDGRARQSHKNLRGSLRKEFADRAVVETAEAGFLKRFQQLAVQSAKRQFRRGSLARSEDEPDVLKVLC